MLKTIIVLGIFYLIIITLAFALKINEMPRFFQDMPHRSDWFKIKKVKLNVHYTFIDSRSVEVVEKKSHGPIIFHYLRVRAIALKMDKNPHPLLEGEEFGVTWSISKL